MSETEKEGNKKFRLFDGFNINDKIDQTVSSLENKYLRWIISIGIAFLILQSIDSAFEMSYLKGRQETFESTVNTLLEDRQVVIDELKEQNVDLKKEILELRHLQVENERLKLKLDTTNLKEN